MRQAVSSDYDFRAGLLRRAEVRPTALADLGTDARAQALALAALVGEEALLDAAELHYGAARADLAQPPPCPALIGRLGASEALRLGMVPWRQIGALTVIATARPEDFPRLRPMLEARLGPVIMALAPRAAIEAAILRGLGPALARVAEQAVPDHLSCRQLKTARLRQLGLVLAALLLGWGIWAPGGLFRALVALSVFTLICATILKALAIIASMRKAPPEPPPPLSIGLPPVTVIVALYRESDIAPRLVRRLARLDYPRDRLEVLIAVEAHDHLTRAALAQSDLPPWMRMVLVPPGRVMTKPRALNHALAQARGRIIGVYDAEDAPQPDQIRKVVAQFQRRGPDVACLQGVLDFYNPRSNWIARCFTLEYAGWFRVMLRGVERMGLIVPLGGTTLFFRRDALEALGAWDAHNVTEDADLGVRLVRKGYRTELIASTTHEEACAHTIPWIKQRSRWTKGCLITWGVHMRAPRQLWRDLGPRRFAAFQVMFLFGALQSLLAPIVWPFWALVFGQAMFLRPSDSPNGFAMLVNLWLLALLIDWTVLVLGLARSGQKLHPAWVVAMLAYTPLATLAAWKAARELFTCPFYWDKTSHGHFDLPEMTKTEAARTTPP